MLHICSPVGHIRAVDGFWGMYRGVGPRVIAGTVGNLVQYNVQDVSTQGLALCLSVSNLKASVGRGRDFFGSLSGVLFTM